MRKTVVEDKSKSVRHRSMIPNLLQELEKLHENNDEGEKPSVFSTTHLERMQQLD